MKMTSVMLFVFSIISLVIVLISYAIHDVGTATLFAVIALAELYIGREIMKDVK